MTRQTPREPSWAEKMLREHIFRVVMTLFGVALLGLAQPYLDTLRGLAAVPAQVAALREDMIAQREDMTKLRADVSVLQLPETIFQVSIAGSAPVDGYCVAGLDCEFDLLMRRSPSAVACRVLTTEPNLPRQFLLQIGPSGEDRREVVRVDRGEILNLGPEWTPVRVVLRMPRNFGVIDHLGVPPAAALVLQRSYDHCTGPTDPTVATRSSNPLPVPILAEAPPAPAGSPTLVMPSPG